MSELAAIVGDLETFIMMPQGIKKLRHVILDRAVRGLLVSQESGDGTADDFLRATQGRLSGSSKLKNLKNERRRSARLRREPEGRSVAGPFAIPNQWRWVRFGDLVINLDSERVPLSRSQREGRSGPYDYYGASGVIDSVDDYLFEGDLLLVGEDGANLLSRSTPIAFIASDRYWVNNHAHVLDAPFPETLAYLALFLNAIDLAPYVTGTAQPKMNQAKLSSIPIAVPPLAEQRRIVAKVNALFGLIDRFETALADLEDARQLLTNNACHELGARHSLLALGILDELVRNVDDISRLECAIIELAVRGQLVPQTPDTGALDALLQSSRSATLDDVRLVPGESRAVEEPYPAPSSWRWVPLGAVLTRIDAGWSPSAQPRPKEEDEWGVLKVSACSWGEFRPRENKALQSDQLPRPNLEVRPEDFLISRANTSELVARSVVVDATPPRLMLSDKTLRLSVIEGCNPRYLNIANLAQAARCHYETEATGTSSSMKNVSQKAIRRTPIPLPPPCEQDRIVAVVGELMGLLRRLRVEMAT